MNSNQESGQKNSNDLSPGKKYLEDVPFELDLDIKDFKLKQIEQSCLDRVFTRLSNLELETSSDEDNQLKKYYKKIDHNAKKKMSIICQDPFNVQPCSINSISSAETERIMSKRDLLSNDDDVKLSSKCLRKVFRQMNYESDKDELDLMIWEIDEDMDGKVSKYEFEKMYKRCVSDTKELEPKKFYYLVQFLMYDKDNKHFITEEDTLELLYIRHGGQGLNSAIDDIFAVSVKDEEGKNKKVIRDKTLYQEYLNRMLYNALSKRAIVKDRKKNYCSYFQSEAIKK